jgi:uncharacterized protein
VIYHGNCPDGFASAWACHKHLDGDIEVVAGVFGHPPPDVRGRDVLIVDFSYARATLVELKSKAQSLYVFDHHKSAESDLEGLDFCFFDMERSGAGLAWDLLPSVYDDRVAPRPRPWLIDYVEDRDLWRFALPESRAVNDAIMVVPHELAAFDALSLRDLADLAAEGRAIGKKVGAYADAVAGAGVRLVDGVFGFDAVPIVNAPHVMVSDLLALVLDRTGSPIAIAWAQRADGFYSYSIRSRGDVDASELARSHGGGGHRNAAGFRATRQLW